MASTPMGERDRRLRAGDEAWAELCAALDAAPPEAPLHDPGSPTWTSRDVYTHFMRMHSGSAAGIEAQLTGKPPPWPEGDENEINERWVTEDRALSLDQARSRAGETRREYRDLLMQLTAEEWTAIRDWHLDDIDGGHYRGHLGYLAGG